MSKTEKQIRGKWGEDAAAAFLSKAGYEVIERNYRAKHCDLDIIAWHTKKHHGKTLCFIEVKTRTGASGTAEAATDYKKKKNMFFAAQCYCLERGISVNQTPMQFEQVSVYVASGSDEPTYKHDVIPVE